MVEMEARIFVLDRGWVQVGIIKRVIGDTVFLRYGACVERWGTNQGLGQLYHGPREETRLRPESDSRIRLRSEIKSLAVNAEAWLPALRKLFQDAGLPAEEDEDA